MYFLICSPVSSCPAGGGIQAVLHELSKLMPWAAALTTGRLSAGIMVLTTVSAKGETHATLSLVDSLT